MHRRLVLAGFAATGGLLTTAFLQAAVAVADISADGADAFTIGGFTFDPFTASFDTATFTQLPNVEGFTPVDSLSGAAPLLNLGGATLASSAVSGSFPLSPQDFEVFSPSTGADLGSIDTGENVTNLLGLTNAEFTVDSVTPATGDTASDLPTVGSVYDAFNLGNGIENIYTAIPGTAGAADTVTDTLVTPNGDVNLDSLFGSIDAAAPLQPGDAFTGLEVGDISSAPDAFSIGGVTLDPIDMAGAEGFDPLPQVITSPPLLQIAGLSELGNPDNSIFDLDLQNFDVFSGSGSSATDVGSITTGEDVTNLLGLTNTELIVTNATAADGASASSLPTVGSVFDAFNLGNGIENVYTAIPGTAGAADTVTDTLVTPLGNINLDSLFGGIDAAAPLPVGDAFTGLQAGDSSIGADAFSIGGFTFDPMLAANPLSTHFVPAGEGFEPVFQTIGAPPLLDIGGGTPAVPLEPDPTVASGIEFVTLPLARQDFNVFDGTGASATEVGNIIGNEDVTNLLGLTNTEFTVASVTPDADASASDLPTVGSVFDAFNLGNGFENVYTAIPGVDGAADTITDTFVTPLGNLDLSSLFGGIDAAMPLDPGDAFTAGLDAATAAASAIDPLAFLGL
jgi:hypothetical protein